MPVITLRVQQDRLNTDVTRTMLPILLRYGGSILDERSAGVLAALLYPRMSSFRSASSALAWAAARAVSADVPRFGAPPYRVEWAARALADTLSPLPGERRGAEGAARATARLIRHVEQAGRDTTIRAAIETPTATGWARVSSGSACGFCLTMISRGVVYASERTGGFQAHDHDRCVATLVRRGQRDWPGAQESADAGEVYARVTRGLSGPDALRAMNRYVDQQNREAVST